MIKKTNKEPKYLLNKEGAFVIKNYNFSKPFSSFLPGIAGKYGIPMWTFYVNRAQCISSFGIKDKDHAILEFMPANKAWQSVSTHGFRTFLKVNRNNRDFFYEPFHNGFTNLSYKITNRLYILPYELTIEEENKTLNLITWVRYFNIPNDNYAGLARIVELKNLNKDLIEIELLDGLPQIIPYGTNNYCLKKMSRTIEAWMGVENLKNNAPFYRLTVDPADRPEVVHIKEGNFYLGFSSEAKKTGLIKPIINPDNIFGPVTDFSCPRLFLNKDFSPPQNETIQSKTPSAFLYSSFILKQNENKKLYALSGYMRSLKDLNASLKRLSSPVYIESKRIENMKLINNLLEDVRTSTSSKEFNLYSQQTYLDNILRGGYPVIFGQEKTFYLYSRKHGDPERDYNRFQISPTYLSQGNGNYRDLNQNRRNEIWFNPKIKEKDLLSLFNLIQLDGFNPLVIKGSGFILQDTQKIRTKLGHLSKKENVNKILLNFTGKKFSPGEIIHFIEDNQIKLTSSYDELLDIIISYSLEINEAEHLEGFWIDHWHYNLDLLDSYLAIYPEKAKEIFFEKRKFTFFDNDRVVKPRKEKYILHNGLPRQLHAVTLDLNKKEMLNKRNTAPNIARSEKGIGGIYQTTLINKLLCLLVNKYASLDPFGVGVEMESDKPNWFDSLNGLPAIFGSSLSETFELKRLALYIKNSISLTPTESIFVTEEIYRLLEKLYILTKEYFNKALSDFQWWDETHLAKESYWSDTKMGVKGKELNIPSKDLSKIVDLFIKKIDIGINRAWDKKSSVYRGYFYHEVTKYEKLEDNFIKPLSFKQIPLPLFLEPQMHGLRLAENQAKAKALYKGVKRSALFDKKLSMYKVTASLKPMPEEIGRCRVFPSGWLENESVWLHMEYKYLLELLKQGLYEEFYQDFKKALIPFQDPKRYGRSILENSSFLVSSAFPDKTLHGNGFVARLSGSTAEFLDIWLKINLGLKPFFITASNTLNLCFKPILNAWLFDKNGKYSFNFLSKIKVIYHNPTKKNTYGKNSAKVQYIAFKDNNGLLIRINSDTIKSPYAEQIRLGKINQIDIHLK